jgi:hypothetical protein
MIDHGILFRTFHILYIIVGSAVILYMLYLLFQWIDRVGVKRNKALTERAKWQYAICLMLKSGAIHR